MEKNVHTFEDEFLKPMILPCIFRHTFLIRRHGSLFCTAHKLLIFNVYEVTQSLVPSSRL